MTNDAGGWKAGGRYRIEFYNFEIMEFFIEFVGCRAQILGIKI